MKYLLSALVLSFAFINPALADKVARIAAPAQQCPFVETSSVSITFNSTETDLTQLKTILSSKIEHIEALGKEKEMTKVELQSSNYSINTNTGSCNAATGQYQFYGNASFNVEPADKAADFMTSLIEKGFQANLSVNSYRQCQ